MTPKQERFVAEYLIGLNATQAAIRAGYSVRTANEQGARLLANVSVQEAIAEGQQSIAQRLGMTLDSHLADLLSIRDKAVAEGRYGPAVAAEIARGKASGLYVDRLDHSGQGGGQVQVVIRLPDNGRGRDADGSTTEAGE